MSEMAMPSEPPSPERWQQIKRIFGEAIELAPSEREAFIERACQGDQVLRRSVESLLSSDEQGCSMLDQPAIAAAAGLLAEDEDLLTAGEGVGHYQVLSLLGRGGMGEVYLAEDRRLGRRIALKVLPSGFVRNERRIERFHHEARAASALNHPNIVTIHEIGQAGDRHFIATEFIDGETLRQRLRSGPLETNEVLDVALQAANALSAAHQAGIMHRDIKPENIMLRRDGYVKVLDFGLAKLIESQPSSGDDREQGEGTLEAPPRLLMGTIRYMSPEQALGLEMDARSDIFSFGVVLYEMVAGRAPFAASGDDDPITTMLNQEPVPLSELMPTTPVALQRIIDKTLRKDKEERHQSSEELLEDLTRIRRGLELQSTLIPSTGSGIGRNLTQASGWLSQRRLALAMLMLTLVAMSGVIAYKSYLRSPARQGGSVFQSISLTRLASLGTITDAALSPDGEYVAYAVVDKNKQRLGLLHIATSTTKELLAPTEMSCDSLTFTPDGRFIYFGDASNTTSPTLYRIPTDGGSPTPILSDILTGVGFSPDGKQIAFIRQFTFGSTNNHVAIANADGTGVRILATATPPSWFYALRPAWSPDGKAIVCSVVDQSGSVCRLIEVQVADGSWQYISDEWSYIPQCEWLPDGSGLLIVASRKGDISTQLWHLSVADGGVHRISNDTSSYSDLSLTVDGRKVLTLQSEALSYLWTSDFDGGNPRQITFAKDDGLAGIAWTPDGKLVFTAYTPGGGALYEAEEDGSNRRRLTPPDAAPWSLAVSPDGCCVIFASQRDGQAKLWRVDRHGDGLAPIPGSEGVVYFAISADSQWLFFSKGVGDTVLLFKLPVSGGQPMQLTQSAFANFPQVSPDGNRILHQGIDFKSRQSQYVILPIDGGPEMQRVAMPGTPDSMTFKWAPDGNSVLYINRVNGESRLWRVPLDGKPAVPLNRFTAQVIYRFDWSAHSHKFVYAAGTNNTTLALITPEQ